MKVLSLFSGIGAFEKALDNLEIPYELIGFSEIDKYATKSYCAIHGVDESMNLGDITMVDEKDLPKDLDLVCYGFPCQDISISGKMRGLFNKDGTKTRSGLFFEALRIIEKTKPRVAIAENVKNLTSKKFDAQFQVVLESLEQAGYDNYWKVLNAKDYGIPQNRERVFIISIRKDIDTGFFRFPEGFPLELRLKDMLDDMVDAKYYLNKGFSLIETSGNVVGMIDMKGEECIRRIYDTEKESPTLTTMEGGHRQPKIFVREATIRGYAEAYEGDSINLEQPSGKTRRGRVGHGVAQILTTSPQQAVAVAMRGRYNEDGRVEQKVEVTRREYANAITTVQKDSMIASDMRIRKLTPKECFRLMGFDDTDFEKAEAVNSNTQLYKQAGNSIVVPVVENIIKMLIECGALKGEENGDDI